MRQGLFKCAKLKVGCCQTLEAKRAGQGPKAPLLAPPRNFVFYCMMACFEQLFFKKFRKIGKKYFQLNVVWAFMSFLINPNFGPRGILKSASFALKRYFWQMGGTDQFDSTRDRLDWTRKFGASFESTNLAFS